MDAPLGTGVITALPGEARTAHVLRRMGWHVTLGGVGEARTRAAVEALLDLGVRRLLVWGTAGALQPGWRAGAVIVPDEIRAADGDRYPMPEAWRAQLRAAVPAGIQAAGGTLVTSAHPVSDRRAKTALARRTGAVAVDMEAALVARYAAERGVPVAALRAIVDPLDTTLPPAVARGLPERQVARTILLRLAARPRDVPGVVRLAAHMRAARRSLAATARGLVTDSGQEPGP